MAHRARYWLGRTLPVDAALTVAQPQEAFPALRTGDWEAPTVEAVGPVPPEMPMPAEPRDMPTDGSNFWELLIRLDERVREAKREAERSRNDFTELEQRLVVIERHLDPDLPGRFVMSEGVIAQKVSAVYEEWQAFKQVSAEREETLRKVRAFMQDTPVEDLRDAVSWVKAIRAKLAVWTVIGGAVWTLVVLLLSEWLRHLLGPVK